MPVDKPKKAKEGIAKWKNYEACLMKNSDAIVDACANNDTAALQAIFTKCKVPADQMNELTNAALDCYNLRYHQW